jgi:hypothetical protein
MPVSVPVLNQLATDVAVLPSKIALVDIKLQGAVLLRPGDKELLDHLVSTKSTLEALLKIASSLQRSVTSLQTGSTTS